MYTGTVPRCWSWLRVYCCWCHGVSTLLQDLGHVTARGWSPTFQHTRSSRLCIVYHLSLKLCLPLTWSCQTHSFFILYHLSHQSSWLIFACIAHLRLVNLASVARTVRLQILSQLPPHGTAAVIVRRLTSQLTSNPVWLLVSARSSFRSRTLFEMPSCFTAS